jgi:hypothetical protein
LVQFVLCPGDACVPHFGIGQTIPATLPGPKSEPNAHLKKLTKELQTATVKAARTPKERCLIKSLATAIKAILTPRNTEEQRVATTIIIGRPPNEYAPIVTIQRISDALEIMQTRDPMAKQNLITTACIHQCQTQNNTPGSLPKIARAQPALIQPDPCQTTTEKQQSTRIHNTTSPVIIIPPARIPRGVRTSAWLISQQAHTAMTLQEALTMPISFTPHKLVPVTYNTCSTNYAHFAVPMIHPTTGKIISSYRRLMNDPATAKVWQTTFGKDFGGIMQGDLKTGQKGTNSVFSMMHKEIDIAMVAGHKWTYMQIVVDHQPQKEDPNQIRITVSGNLITYKGSTLTHTANLTTSKLLWNSVLSTEGATYMCLDIKNFDLTAALDYYEYMKIPLALFLEWIKIQYNLDTHARDGFVFWKSGGRSGASHRQEFWQTNN